MTGDQTTKQAFKTLGELRAAALKSHQKGDLATARNLYRMYLAHQPGDATFWSNLGALFRTEKNFDMAAACQRRAVFLDGKSESVLNNAANALYDAGEVEDALELRRKALELAPGKAENYTTLAKCLRGLGRHAEAQTVLEKALRVHPDDPELHIQLSFCQLSQGNYRDGFKSFHWRWQGDEISPPDFAFPQWQGEDLTGKTILVTPEQGFGDTVLMARFLAPLKALGGTVKFACKPPLRRVFAQLAGIDSFPETNAEVADCDYWTPMMDLPRWLGTTLDTIPPKTELSVPQDAIDRARAMTAPFKGMFKLGVLWSGSVTYRANHKRSFSHRNFLQLSNIASLQMFSLYKGPLLEEFHQDGTSCVILDAAGNDRDFADCAALMRELDLVVTMDSAIAHVAGSLDVPVWNLLHSEAYWLYEPFDDHTPWYPSMRLIRQRKSGNWDAVFNALHVEVSKIARESLERKSE
ncbi:MAG: tetratricopeptide repeat protein [Rhodobacteraceae bacterium]|nr:tetratricopeptide repeat protein [Paracoccaceae bacterium]